MNLYAINQIVSLVDVTDSKTSIHQDLIVPIMVTLAHEEEYTTCGELQLPAKKP